MDKDARYSEEHAAAAEWLTRQITTPVIAWTIAREPGVSRHDVFNLALVALHGCRIRMEWGCQYDDGESTVAWYSALTSRELAESWVMSANMSSNHTGKLIKRFVIETPDEVAVES